MIAPTAGPIKSTVDLPNSPCDIEARLPRVERRSVWGMLWARIALALLFQSLLALGFLLAGDATAWRTAADWWLASFALAEFVNLSLLRRLASAEGMRLRDLYNLGGPEPRRDLKWTGLAMLVAAPLVLIPSLVLAGALWGDAQSSQDLIFRAVPVGAAWAMLAVFPVIHALTELPTYFGYVMPRMEVLTGKRLLPMLVTASVLSVQHVFLPLLFDWRYIVWRALMFLPLAIWFAWVIRRRPTALPYLAVAHGLLDLSLPIYVLIASIT
ncbi:MAG: hypothetical protein WA726_02505 [Acidimicrobiia bacterium]